MPINLHISGETANEFQDALTAVLGLLGSPTLAAAAENKIVVGETSTAAPEPKAAPARKPRETKNEPAKPATEASSDAGSTQESSDVTSDSGQTAAAAASPSEKPASEQIVDNDPPTTKKLDFDKEVAPKVLGYVRYKGKAWVEEILSEFGVKRASDLDDDRLPELLETLEDRGGELPK